MKKWVNYIVLVVILGSCSNGPTRDKTISENVIPKDSMITVMIDMNILEASINLNQVNGTTNPNNEKYYDIFKRHNITGVQYDESLKEYSKDPAELSKMYDQVIEKLSKMQARVNE